MLNNAQSTATIRPLFDNYFRVIFNSTKCSLSCSSAFKRKIIIKRQAAVSWVVIESIFEKFQERFFKFLRFHWTHSVGTIHTWRIWNNFCYVTLLEIWIFIWQIELSCFRSFETLQKAITATLRHFSRFNKIKRPSLKGNNNHYYVIEEFYWLCCANADFKASSSRHALHILMDFSSSSPFHFLASQNTFITREVVESHK